MLDWKRRKSINILICILHLVGLSIFRHSEIVLCFCSVFVSTEAERQRKQFLFCFVFVCFFDSIYPAIIIVENKIDVSKSPKHDRERNPSGMSGYDASLFTSEEQKRLASDVSDTFVESAALVYYVNNTHCLVHSGSTDGRVLAPLKRWFFSQQKMGG